jgi:undecaprenyl-diphosphatase
MLTSIDDRVFLLLNAPAHAAWGLVLTADIVAEGTIYAAMVLMAVLWIWAHPERRAGQLATVIGVSLALGINQLLGLLWYEPRPFVLGLGHALNHHAADNSFPSDHATFMWALGLGLVVTGAARYWGMLVCLTGLVVAWARVYLGLHYPIDMAGSFAVAVISCIITNLLAPAVRQWLCPVVESLYDRLLLLLHLPATVFPRGNGSMTQAEHEHSV